MLLCFPLEGTVVLCPLQGFTQMKLFIWASLDNAIKLQQPPSPGTSDPPYVTLIFPLIS